MMVNTNVDGYIKSLNPKNTPKITKKQQITENENNTKIEI